MTAELSKAGAASSEQDVGIAILLGIIFATVFLFHGLSLGAWAFLGIFGTLYMFKLKNGKKIKNMQAFATIYVLLSVVLYLFAFLKAMSPTLFWIILVITVIALMFVMLILVSFIAIRERPENKE